MSEKVTLDSDSFYAALRNSPQRDAVAICDKRG